MQTLTDKEIIALADMARIPLTPETAVKVREKFETVIQFIQRILEVPVPEAVDDSFDSVSFLESKRHDIATPVADDVLAGIHANVPDRVGEHVSVPPVVSR